VVNRLTRDEALEILEAMDVAVMVADIINGGSWVTWVNTAFTRVFGYTLDQMHDFALNRLMGEETDMAEIDRMYQAVRRGNRASVTVTAYCADGTSFWSSFTMSPVFAGDMVVGWVGVQHDVSDFIRRSQQDRRSYELERRARIGLSTVGVASDLMAEVDNPAPLRSVAQMLSGDLVSWAGFFDVDGGRLRPLVGVEPPEDSRGRRRAADLDGASRGGVEDPITAVLTGEEPERGWIDLAADYSPDTPVADLQAVLRPHRAAFASAADRVLVVPVVGRRRTLCVLAVLPRVTDMVDAESAEEIATIIELVARRVGLTMENARYYAQEHRLAETLQRAMLPEQAHVADLDVWTYYAPNAEHAQVGGDWYDVIHVSEEAVGVVIGDVAGHDVEAAATMGQLRSIVRSYACELVEPGVVLDRVDALVAGMRVPRSASLVYAALTPAGKEWDVAYSRAGHLPPLLIRGGAVTSLAGAGGSLIGFGTRPRGTAHARLIPGDVVVFYTDGLVERRDRAMRAGVVALEATCADLSARDAAGVGEELLATLADAPEDDVAVVVVRVPEPGTTGLDGSATPRRRRWQLPADPPSIGRARHAVLGSCAAWGIEDTAAAELVVSELVANAVMHGWGRIGLRVEDTPAGLRIEVQDENPEPPTELEGHETGIGGYGLTIIGRLAEWGWEPADGGKVVWALVPTRRSRARGLDRSEGS